MRRILVQLLVSVMFLGIFAPQSAQAVFGFSKCEKVWKEINSQESKILSFFGNYPERQEVSIYRGSPEELKFKNSLSALHAVWKLGINNQKCLSNSQIIAVKGMKSDSYKRNLYDWRSGTYGTEGSFETWILGRYVKLSSR